MAVGHAPLHSPTSIWMQPWICWQINNVPVKRQIFIRFSCVNFSLLNEFKHVCVTSAQLSTNIRKGHKCLDLKSHDLISWFSGGRMEMFNSADTLISGLENANIKLIKRGFSMACCVFTQTTLQIPERTSIIIGNLFFVCLVSLLCTGTFFCTSNNVQKKKESCCLKCAAASTSAH